MKRLAVTAGALAVAVSLLPSSATALRVPVLETGVWAGGPVTDLSTGEAVAEAPGDGFGHADTTAYVLPYRRGARYRIAFSVTVNVPGVRVLDVRVVTGPGSALRHGGTVYEIGCCALAEPRPLAPVRFDRDEGRGRVWTMMVGLDVEMCCATPPAGWTEVVPGYAFTYEALGATRTVYQPFHELQQIVVRA